MQNCLVKRNKEDIFSSPRPELNSVINISIMYRLVQKSGHTGDPSNRISFFVEGSHFDWSKTVFMYVLVN
jgi:hypothetical protein